ncbi:MAG: ABC transporter ATP-binding protein [Acidobacteria bacterium]|nr:ABC transporter ATP-binding protein [Acidobacteriota bacterium]
MRPIYAIETVALKKSYKDVEALRGMSLQVPQGSLCGLVGLNGAGKTTTIRLLLAMAKPDSGSASVLGLDALNAEQNRLIRSRTAYIPERKDLFPYMSAREVIRFTASFYPGWNLDLETRYVNTFEIPLDRNVTQLSKGTLTKLHMLMAIARGTDLLVLDEPTDGLDAIASEETLQALVSLVADYGTTVLICSHRLEEIEQISDHVCLVHKGQCFKQGSLDEIRATTRRIQFVLEPDPDQFAQLSQLGILKQDGRSISILTDRAETIEVAKSFGASDIEAYPVPLRELFVESVRRQDALA